MVLPPTANAFPSAKNALLSFEKPQKIVKNHVQNTTVVKIRNLRIPFRNHDCTVQKHQKIPIFLYVAGSEPKMILPTGTSIFHILKIRRILQAKITFSSETEAKNGVTDR
tara:strand:+ start:166 stop:495 length:330 start_codon:yes stop_codon:yes gene_type:complete